MATIGLIDYLVKWNKLTRVMFCSVVAEKKLEFFFPPEKAQDVRWEVVAWVVSVFWLWREIVLKMRTRFYKKFLLGYFFMIR